MADDRLVWPVDLDLLPDVEGGKERARLQDAVDTAVMVLWRLTGAQFGLQRVLARPCPRVQDTHNMYTSGAGGAVPVLYAGKWYNQPCPGGNCQEDGMGSVYLPGPVHSIEKVVVEGDTIDPSSWAHEGNYLKRTGGHTWPGQVLSRPLGEPGTWWVVYLRGRNAPPGAGARVAALATEFYKSINGEACRLPKQWTQVQRQGVSIQKLSPQELLEAGGTGLPEVDTWVNAINPHGLVKKATVASVDTLGGR